MEKIVIKRGMITSLDKLPQYSIALDGFVQGPEVDTENHRFSFDHHAKCLRYCTTAACMQAWTAVLLGDFEDLDKYTIYANDVDADVCLAVWCLKNADRCKEPLVKKLVDSIGWADMTTGIIGPNGMTKIVEWICEPETSSKKYDDYHKISDEGLMSILESVLYRIDLYVNGESVSEVKSHEKSKYKILRNENDWVLIESQDPHIYTQLYQMGFSRIVLIRPQSDGSNAVSLAKKGDFTDKFPMFKLYEKLNVEEAKIGKSTGTWGGGSTNGGAPRNHDGSRTWVPISVLISSVDEIVLSS